MCADQPSQPAQANLSQRYPATSYNTTYPWNTVFQQEWGHVEYDNTQGSELIESLIELERVMR